MKLIQEGNRQARIMLVGEAPGETEERAGRPFIGGSGQLLDRMLASSGISRSECFITNICHVRPPKNDFKWFYTKQGQLPLMQGILQLRQDIIDIRPNLIVALGSHPLRILTDKIGIESWRGSILESQLAGFPVKVIGTYHPAYILRVYAAKGVAEFDLRRAAQESAFPEIVLPVREFVLNPDPATRQYVAQQMLQAEWLSVDIECTPRPDGSWKLSCVGFADRADRAMVIPCITQGDMETIRILCGSDQKKVLQNGSFDESVLLNEGIALRNFAWDTMLAHHALYPESASGGDEMAAMSGKKRTGPFAKGLAFQTSIYTREPYYKADGKIGRDTQDDILFWTYNAKDAAVTHEIREVQEKQLVDFGVMDNFQESMRLLHVANRATRQGMRVNLEERQRLKREAQERLDRLQAFLDGSVGEPVNVKSSKQMTALLYDKLKLPERFNDAGNRTADKDTLVELGLKHNNPVLHTIISVRQERDLIERYLDVKLSPDGRMRCSLDLTGTRSGRLSSRAWVDGTGTNLQNQPGELRSMFIPDDGKIFIYRDFSQAEARVVAYLAMCDRLIELFEDPERDVHTENAARIFGHSVAKRQKHGGPVTETQRYLAKRVVHACNYGMAAKRLVEVVNADAQITGVKINAKEAQSLIDRYFFLYPEIQENFWKYVEKELRFTRTLVTPFGRKRQFFDRWSDTLLREAYSYIPQSTVGDLCRIAMRQIGEAAHTNPDWQACGVDVLMNVHDSILVQCNRGAENWVAKAMRELMRIPIVLHGREFYIPTDCKVGLNWGDKSDTNPLGLEELDETA